MSIKYAVSNKINNIATKMGNTCSNQPNAQLDSGHTSQGNIRQTVHERTANLIYQHPQKSAVTDSAHYPNKSMHTPNSQGLYDTKESQAQSEFNVGWRARRRMRTGVNQPELRVNEIPRVHTGRVMDGSLAPSYIHKINTPLPATVLKRRNQSSSESSSSSESLPINKHETQRLRVVPVAN